MGCGKSAEKENQLKATLSKQAKQIKALQDANTKITVAVKEVLEQRKTQKPKEVDLEAKLKTLEGKLTELTVKLAEVKRSDTFSRGDSDLHGEVPGALSPQPQPRPPSSILQDPAILEMLAKHKQKFLKKPPQPSEQQDSLPSLINSAEFSNRE